MDCDTSRPPDRPDPYAAWRIGSYRLYAVSWFLMTFAKQIETVALSICVYHEAGMDVRKGALALGWLGLVQASPIMILAIAGGHIADRWERRGVVVAMLGLTGAVSLALTLVVFLHAPLLWIYMLLLVGATGQALGGPSRTALLPQLVPGEVFSNAVAWNSTVFQIAR